MEQNIREAIKKALGKLGIEPVDFIVEHPAELAHGDFASNVALVAGKRDGKDPKKLAQKLAQKLVLEQAEKIEVAGAGFINFHLSRDFFAESVIGILRQAQDFGKNSVLAGRKVMVEYTDPNPFKVFHIGHLMNNAIGEAVSRLIEFSGADVKRANYQGDVGVHVAKAIWGKMQKSDLSWGDAYALGSRLYKGHRDEIDELNKVIYEQSDKKVQKLYKKGKKETLAEFEKMYELLGTTFDEYFFESEVAGSGKEIVEKETGEVFEKSDGAIVFPKEKSGLHTRVFLNSQGIPTYEAKELALAKIKYERYPYDHSIAVIGNEVDEYFKVVHKAMELVYPDLAEKTQHLSHGMLRLPSGKMSSRTGDVIAAKSLIDDVKGRVLKKIDPKAFGNARASEKIAQQIAVGAIKYEILKQTPGKDIVFDMEKSLSLEGDSGPYLQYTYVRTRSLLEKAKSENIRPTTNDQRPEITQVERLLYRFPEVVKDATEQYAPQKIVHFLTGVASSFNTLYAAEKIVDADDAFSPYKLAVTASVATVLKNGLWLLGIETPEQM